MSIPIMEGFSGSIPTSANKFADSDVAAFRLPVVEPGGESINENSWWYNLGYANLYNAQLSLVEGGTMDTGADADTIDVMAIKQSGGYILAQATPATVANTSGWAIPIDATFQPFVSYFRAGIKWNPPLGATVGVIRKCFQWDGSYYPNTWDFVYYPMANEYYPDSTFYSDPMSVFTSGGSVNIRAKAGCSTGYCLTLVADKPFLSDTYQLYEHSTAGDPWVDGVNNATGYVIEFRIEDWGFGLLSPELNNFSIEIRDGTYSYEIYITGEGVIDASGFATPISDDFSTDELNTYQIKVQGSSFEIYRNGVLRASSTLNVASPLKKFGFKVTSLTGASNGAKWYLDYIKYFLGGTTPPIF